MKRITFNIRSGSKGQSFVELSLIALLLMLLVAGIAEFGVLLNHYLNLLDGVREAARFGANYDPFAACFDAAGVFDADNVCNEFYQSAALEAKNVISPIVLDPAKGDDIVLSFFTVAGDPATCVRQITKYPTYENGYSWSEKGDGNWLGNGTRNKESQQTILTIQSKMDSCAPPVSVFLVEVFYNYPQTLRAPFYEQVFPDPIPVYIYAIMPLKSVTIPP
jgi:hypothetical protein